MRNLIIACLLFSQSLISQEFHSQAYQDQFVHHLLYKLLNKQDEGHYLEIGAWQPIYINNTYVFEKDFGWKGVSIDISDAYVPDWKKNRQNMLLIQDATEVDYNALLLSFPCIIDYLSLDVDGNYDAVLRKIPLNTYKFKVITIEHDYYRYGDVYRSKEREILSSFGYCLICSDVSMGGDKFEDWWIHPDCFPAEIVMKLQDLNLHGKEYYQIIENLQSSEIL
ncbi:MAG: hypothetical protein HY069_04300 [Chlamydiia bacterium]|nr:hypothetical protein [Chlamydiia bacterium]